MITEQGMSKGVYAYYLWQCAPESEKSQRKNAARNFRKGYAFARSLPAGFVPRRVIELGPGSGWFLRGVKEVFPAADFFAWDIVADVGVAMSEQHGFSAVSTDLATLAKGEGFDLLIARDVVEHFADAGLALKQIASLLKPEGLFHFITPNGHKDLWKFYAARVLGYKKPAELLLNHVNYFDGKGLLEYLNQIGLHSVAYYTYDFSAWKMGIGWRALPRLAAGSHGLKADDTIAQYETRRPSATLFQPPALNWFSRVWYRWKYWRAIRINPAYNFGHEIFGLFRKI
jgi:SAM-dependent methyltransferase